MPEPPTRVQVKRMKKDMFHDLIGQKITITVKKKGNTNASSQPTLETTDENSSLRQTRKLEDKLHDDSGEETTTPDN